ncbi:hypothetical protein [Bacillus coahuilensis]|uniref:hypothetical protein n=1 Tax=Bacillus coahuilensis TaxID=408580 RepID=UPI000185123F|nr:hypothetical protein [Bacillus coahuilensis]
MHERKKKKSTKSRLDKELERRSITTSSLDISEWEVKQFKEKDWNLLSVYAKRFLSLPPAQRTLRTNQLANIFLSKVDLEVGKLTEEQKEEALLSLYLWLKEEWEYDF